MLYLSKRLMSNFFRVVQICGLSLTALNELDFGIEVYEILECSLEIETLVHT